MDMPIITTVQKMEMVRDIRTFLVFGISRLSIPMISMAVDEESEFIEELSVDMAAANMPASMIPRNPRGR